MYHFLPAHHRWFPCHRKVCKPNPSIPSDHVILEKARLKRTMSTPKSYFQRTSVPQVAVRPRRMDGGDSSAERPSVTDPRSRIQSNSVFHTPTPLVLKVAVCAKPSLLPSIDWYKWAPHSHFNLIQLRNSLLQHSNKRALSRTACGRTHCDQSAAKGLYLNVWTTSREVNKT